MAEYIGRQRMNFFDNFLTDKNGILQNFRLDPIRGFNVAETTFGNIMCEYTGKFAAMVAKKFDDETIRAIIEFAKEEGITDLRVLNGPFILAAIKEKMERDGIGCGFLADQERPDGSVPRAEGDDSDTGGNQTIQG